MEKSNFWNDACRGGAIIGLAMAVSNVAEQAMLLKGGIGMYGLVIVEWLALAGVFIWLLYRFTRKRAALYALEEGFSFGQGFGFIVVMSLLSGLIAGAAGYFYRHVAIGYDVYTERYIDSVNGLLSEVPVPAATVDAYELLFEQLRSTPEPSIFAAIASSMFWYVVAGGLIGLVIAGVISRAPRPFDTEGGN
ncbi:DUF4199 domain-containing protein [uncultured Alistipes sp.]|jgi:hypothetical protein|uniref:DUF4199 domain-containing protein n=1 Tax=Alistipes TaxID=239759 RepID=UPI00266D516C|nr:DUF4199 domain-containing protein [uncultured Alistipes sp.]